MEGEMSLRHPLVVSGVVGDVLEPFTTTVELQVYSDGNIIVNGARLRPSQVIARPRIRIGGSADDFRTFYTIVMVDADAPTPTNPRLKDYLHWLVTDIPGSAEASLGKEIISYESPHPSMGIHRLVFALFRQPRRRSVIAPRLRNNFNVKEFSDNNQLGLPVAAMYYNCNRENGTGCRRTIP